MPTNIGGRVFFFQKTIPQSRVNVVFNFQPEFQGKKCIYFYYNHFCLYIVLQEMTIIYNLPICDLSNYETRTGHLIRSDVIYIFIYSFFYLFSIQWNGIDTSAWRDESYCRSFERTKNINKQFLSEQLSSSFFTFDCIRNIGRVLLKIHIGSMSKCRRSNCRLSKCRLSNCHH
jgi:hypothetical protein